MTVQNHSRKPALAPPLARGWCGTFRLLLLLVLVSPVAHAAVQEVLIEHRLEGIPEGESITLDIAQNTRSSLSFGLPPGAQGVTLNGNAASIANGTLDIALSCQTCRVRIAYVLEDAVSVESVDTLVYTRTLSLPQDPERLRYQVILPPGTFIDGRDARADPAIVPQESAIRSDGTSIIIEWDTVSPTLPIRYFVRFSNHEATEDLGSEILSELVEWPFWTLALLALVLGVGLGMALQRYRTKSLATSLPYVPASLLSPDERTVLTVLEEHRTMMQKELGKRLNWSKSKISAIVSNLDHKGIIAREKIGRNYRITLLKEMGE